MKTTPTPSFIFDIWATASGGYVGAQYQLQDLERMDDALSFHWTIKFARIVLKCEIFFYGVLVDILGLLWTWK